MKFIFALNEKQKKSLFSELKLVFFSNFVHEFIYWVMISDKETIK